MQAAVPGTLTPDTMHWGQTKHEDRETMQHENCSESAAFSHFCESLVYSHCGSWPAVRLSRCSASPSDPLTPLCDGDPDAAAPVDEEALWGAAVLRLHADTGSWCSEKRYARICSWLFEGCLLVFYAVTMHTHVCVNPCSHRTQRE